MRGANCSSWPGTTSRWPWKISRVGPEPTRATRLRRPPVSTDSTCRAAGLEPAGDEVGGLARARAARGVIGDQPLGQQDLVHRGRIPEPGPRRALRDGRGYRERGDRPPSSVPSCWCRRAPPRPVERPVSIPVVRRRHARRARSRCRRAPAPTRRAVLVGGFGPSNRDGVFGDRARRHVPRDRARARPARRRGAAVRQARHRRLGRRRALSWLDARPLAADAAAAVRALAALPGRRPLAA